MAKKDKKDSEAKSSEERIYTVPLSSGWLQEPRNRRSKRAANDIKSFLMKNLKADDVKISEKLNSTIWKSGAQKPPRKIKIKVKMEEGIAKARLPDETEEVKKTGKKGKLEKLRGGIGAKEAAKTETKEKPEEKIEEKSELEKKLDGQTGEEKNGKD